MSSWRRFGWHGVEAVVPAAWVASKLSTDRAQGEVWLADEQMPRLQVKWFDVSKQKSVDVDGMLENYVKQIGRQARKKGIAYTGEDDIKLVAKSGRNISSLRSFHWLSGDPEDTTGAAMETYGAIWYCVDSQRVTLAQVNGAPREEGLKTLARRVLNSLRDQAGDAEWWTASELECQVPRRFALKKPQLQAGYAELQLADERARHTVAVARYGLAAILLERSGDLGDWAQGQRHATWQAYRLERTVTTHEGHPAMRFTGRKRNPVERLRAVAFGLVGQAWPVRLNALVWHCEEANCLFVVEEECGERATLVAEAIAGSVPCRPLEMPPPKA